MNLYHHQITQKGRRVGGSQSRTITNTHSSLQSIKRPKKETSEKDEDRLQREAEPWLEVLLKVLVPMKTKSPTSMEKRRHKGTSKFHYFKRCPLGLLRSSDRDPEDNYMQLPKANGIKEHPR